jgi:hypothetical protein
MHEKSVYGRVAGFFFGTPFQNGGKLPNDLKYLNSHV